MGTSANLEEAESNIICLPNHNKTFKSLTINYFYYYFGEKLINCKLAFSVNLNIFDVNKLYLNWRQVLAQQAWKKEQALSKLLYKAILQNFIN